MNFLFSPTRFWVVSYLALSLLSLDSAGGYDSPNFDAPAFDRDGVFLETSDKEGLLEALAAIASNFPSQSKVDDDLRERAIAIALHLEPLHYNSRMAHDALLSRTVPESTPYFDSLSRVSETLWTTSSQLRSEPAEPEERKLAFYLMDLSLVIHPDPPEERLKEYARATRGKPLGWNNFTNLDPIENASTSRSASLRKEAFELLRRPQAGGASVATTGGSSSPPLGGKGGKGGKGMKGQPGMKGRAEGADPLEALASFEPVTLSLYTVRHVKAVESVAMSGKMTLNVRPASTPMERELLLLPPGADPQKPIPAPLFATTGGPSMENIRFSGGALDSAGLEWVTGTIGELTFESEQDPPAPWRTCTITAGAPAFILVQAALSGKEINQDIILTGGATRESTRPMISGPLDQHLKAAALLDKPYLLIPGSVRSDLADYLNETQDLSVLFEPELVMYTSRAGAINRMTSSTPVEWREASESFAEIKAVSERMSLVELSRNAKVQERLEAILEIFPSHLSAKAMLEFGRGGAGSSTSGGGDIISQIGDLMEPYYALRKSDADLNDLRNRFAGTQRDLSEIRNNLPLELRGYQAAAEDALDAIEDYLALSNRTTSIGIQKLREVDEALNRVSTERAELGLAE